MFKIIIQLLGLIIFTESCFRGSGGGDNSGSGDCTLTTPTPEEIKCVIGEGIKQLLALRNEEWGWGARSEAEALLSIHLANDEKITKTDPDIYISVKEMMIVLLDAIHSDQTLSSQDWSRGKLSYYILALYGLCQNPNDFYGNKLLDILKGHLTTSSTYFEGNKFAYALSILALCTSNVSLDDSFYQKISETPGTYKFGVDEASLVYQAFKCINDGKYQTEKQAAFDYILNAQNDDELFGNEYTTALAIQAIFVSRNESLYPRTMAGLKFLAKSIDKKNDPKPSKALLISVLPVLATKSFIDVRQTQCIFKGRDYVSNIFVDITVFNNLTATFNQKWTAHLGTGQSLYDAMDNLRNSDSTFSFSAKQSTFGHYITGMCGMPASTDDRQYWQILNGDHVPLSKGVDSTYPKDGDEFIFWMTTW